MSKTKRDKNAIIKKVDWSSVTGIPNGKTLQQCMDEMYKTDILETVVSHKPELLELLHCQKTNDCFVGVLAVYEEGKCVEVITRDQKTKKKIITQQKLREGEKLESALYFAVHENRVAVVQSNKLHVKALQAHLNNLLGNHFADYKGFIMLLDSIPEDIKNLIRDKGVKQILFAQELHATEGQAVKIASGLFGSKISSEWNKKLKNGLDEVEHSGLKTSVVVELSGQKNSAESIRLIQAMAIGLSNDLEGVTLLLMNKQKIKNHQLVTWRGFKVTYDDGVPILTEMFKGLHSALQELVVTL